MRTSHLIRLTGLIPALVALSLASCSSLKDNNAPPSGLQCDQVINGGGDAASLTTALKTATSGSCVLVVTQTYSGNFGVPAGVTLASAQGSRAIFTGTDANLPAISLTGDPKTGVWDVDVHGSAQVGIAVKNGAAHIENVTVNGAASAAIGALCTDASTCHDGAHTLVLDDVHLVGNAFGLWTKGADVMMTGGEASQNTSQTLSGGDGIVAFGGAHVTLDGTSVIGNDQVGILFDASGDTGTTGDLKSVDVSQNGARGVWAQHLNGTIDAPALKIEGASSLSGNKIVGLGATESHGIIFVGGKIENTVASPIVTDLGTQEQVGDGFGMFNNTGEVKFDSVAITNSARAGGLVDTATGVIIFVGGSVGASASNLKIVVQNTSAANATALQIPADTVTTSPVLGFTAPQITVGSVL
ncbi:MAG: hypothetical protein ABI461_22190 [Polyangiaceae bacterium]